MPNHIQNRITADAEAIRRIALRLEGPERRVDFNRLIRMPEHQPGIFFAGDALSQEDEQSHLRSNWYEWSSRCWGTSWNAYAVDDERNSATALYFRTVGSAPFPVIYALAAAEPSLSWTWEYADEDIGSNFGRIRCEEGRVTFPPAPEDPVRFGCDLHQWDAQKYAAR